MSDAPANVSIRAVLLWCCLGLLTASVVAIGFDPHDPEERLQAACPQLIEILTGPDRVPQKEKRAREILDTIGPGSRFWFAVENGWLSDLSRYAAKIADLRADPLGRLSAYCLVDPLQQRAMQAQRLTNECERSGSPRTCFLAASRFPDSLERQAQLLAQGCHDPAQGVSDPVGFAHACYQLYLLRDRARDLAGRRSARELLKAGTSTNCLCAVWAVSGASPDPDQWDRWFASCGRSKIEKLSALWNIAWRYLCEDRNHPEHPE